MKRLFDILSVFLLITGIMVLGESIIYPQPSEYGPAILNWGPNVKYGGTVKYIDTYGKITLNFNPFSTTAIPTVNLVYEPLFFVNLADVITPMLGTSYKWTDNNLELIVTTRQGVKWSDGVPFTAKDVAFTFNYIKAHPSIDTSGVWSPSFSKLQTVEASGDTTVIFKFSSPQTALFYTIVGLDIIPEHIWGTIQDPSKYVDTNPVGTGPFMYKEGSFNAANNSLTMVKNPNYWMKGRPYVDAVYYLSSSNTSYILMQLLQHNFDWSNLGSGIDPTKLFVDKDPSANVAYWLPINTNELYFNTQKYPFNIPAFRKAIALVINRHKCLEDAYFNMFPVINPLGILPQQAAEWQDPALDNLISTFKYDPQEAEKILASAGFKKNSSGDLCGPNGKPLPTFRILVGAGWGDYIAQAEIIEQGLKLLGISAVTDQQVWAPYMSSFMSGTYDMGICWGNGTGAVPYTFYYSEFNPAFSASKIGEIAVSDFSRYTNPLITAALQVYSETSNLRLQKQAIYTIERIFLDDVPFVPLTNEGGFGEFVTTQFTGWPSSSAPYVYQVPMDSRQAEMVALNVHLK
ncbi:MAG: ABC transporter substrate-binding protein [Sulfolobaceae archaeon]